MAKKATENKKQSKLTEEQKAQKEARLQVLKDKNAEKTQIKTKSGKMIPDFKLRAFEKTYEKELDKVAEDFREINSTIYDSNVAEGESPIIEEAKEYFLETYLGFEPLNGDEDGIEKGNYYKATKAFFKALRDGEIAELTVELGLGCGVTIKE